MSIVAAMAAAGAATASYGVALIDLSTGEFTTAEYRGRDGLQALADEIAVLRPRETGDGRRRRGAGAAAGDRTAAGAGHAQPRPGRFEAEAARQTLLDQLEDARPRGIRPRRPAGRRPGRRRAACTTCATRRRSIWRTCAPCGSQGAADCLIIDPITLQHLEVVHGSEGGAAGSLLHEIDRTVTSMGGRLLRAWLLRPLLALEPDPRSAGRASRSSPSASTERGRFREALKDVHDLERLVARAALGTAGPRDLVALRQSIAAVPRVQAGCSTTCRRRCSAACAPSSTTWPTCAT